MEDFFSLFLGWDSSEKIPKAVRILPNKKELQYNAPMIIERENLKSENQNCEGDQSMISTVTL